MADRVPGITKLMSNPQGYLTIRHLPPINQAAICAVIATEWGGVAQLGSTARLFAGPAFFYPSDECSEIFEPRNTSEWCGIGRNVADGSSSVIKKAATPTAVHCQSVRVPER